MKLLRRLLSNAVEEMGEESFGGVPLSELNEVAKTVPNGLRVEIEGDFLVLYYKSNSGKTIYHPQMWIENGELVGRTVYYPNQYWTPLDGFLDIVNGRYTFQEE